jgi:C4-dicarboxylate transporter
MSQIVAQRLVSAASRLLGTRLFAMRKSVEMSLDAADTSVCATILSQEFSMMSGGPRLLARLWRYRTCFVPDEAVDIDPGRIND